MIEFILGCILLIAGGLFTAFPRDKRYITRLINIEVAEFGLVLIMLSLSEVLALVTFIAVNIVSTFIFVRLIEKKEGREMKKEKSMKNGGRMNEKKSVNGEELINGEMGMDGEEIINDEKSVGVENK